LVLVSVIALFEAGQLEVARHSRFYGSIRMKRFFKIAGWLTALFLGLFVWNVAPDYRPIVTWLLAAAFICYLLSAVVEVSVKRIICDELLALRRQIEIGEQPCRATKTRRDARRGKAAAVSTLRRLFREGSPWGGPFFRQISVTILFL
jgi:hypothetical protein